MRDSGARYILRFLGPGFGEHLTMDRREPRKGAEPSGEPFRMPKRRVRPPQRPVSATLNAAFAP